MSFPENLRTLRTKRGLTQQALADAVGLQALQIRRYESGKSQPMLEALRGLALTLGCSTDELVFGETARGPQKSALRYQMEAIEKLPKKAQTAICDTLEALINWHNRA